MPRHPTKRLEVPDEHEPILESPSANVSRAHGPMAQVYQNNTLSTPVLVALLVAFFVAAALSAGAIGVALNAESAAQMAERNAKLAQYQLEEALRSAGIAPAKESP